METAPPPPYRLPAEFEPISRVWLSPPHNPETWPGCLREAQQQFDLFVHLLRQSVSVQSLASLGIATDDSWVRDFGPLFVQDANGQLVCQDFRFNGWGGKYEVRAQDDAVGQAIAERIDCPRIAHDWVLEGGAVESNGRGTLLVSEPCVIDERRNPGLTREEAERRLADTLGARNVVWLRVHLQGDDTDGHVDTFARFVNPQTILACRADGGHPDYDTLTKLWQQLEAARDQDGERFALLPLPMPEPVEHDYPADRFGPGGKQPLPLSYANFLIANDRVLVPIYRQAKDTVALKVIDEAFPEHRVFGIPADVLAVGMGAFHCLSMQEPTAGFTASARSEPSG